MYLYGSLNGKGVRLAYAILETLVCYIACLKDFLMFHSFSSLLISLFSVELIKCCLKVKLYSELDFHFHNDPGLVF